MVQDEAEAVPSARPPPLTPPRKGEGKAPYPTPFALNHASALPHASVAGPSR